MSASVISRGTRGRPAPKAMGDGPMVCQPRGSPSGMWSSPSQGRLALAFRPAWPIWMPGTAPANSAGVEAGSFGGGAWGGVRRFFYTRQAPPAGLGPLIAGRRPAGGV